MSRFKDTFKKSALDQNDKRQNRVTAFKSNRRNKRGLSFAAKRNVNYEEDDPEYLNDMNIPTNNENQQLERAQKVKQDSVKMRLQKWKEEKEKQKLKELQLKSHARPPFRAGNVHHSNQPIDILPINAGKAVKKTLPGSTVKKFDFTANQSAAKFGPAQQQARNGGAVMGLPAGKMLFTFQQKTAQVPVSKGQQMIQTRTLRSQAVASSTITAEVRPTSSRRGQVPAAQSAKPKGSVKATPASRGLNNPSEATPSISRRGQVPAVGLRKVATSVGQSSVSKSTITATRFVAASGTTPSIHKDQILSVPTKATPADSSRRQLKPAQLLATPSLSGPGTTPLSRKGKNITAAKDGKEFSKGTPVVEKQMSASPPKNVQSTSQQAKKANAADITTSKSVTPSKKNAAVMIKPETLSKLHKQDEIHDCAYFRAVLASTIAKLENTCDEWELESKGKQMSDEANEQLLLATGMARLLIREKFAQFRGLIGKCEDPSDTTTMCTDLQGFWDMIYMQVEDINNKFKHLEAMKNNDWKPLESASNVKVEKKKVATAKAKPKPAPKGRSNFRAFMAASRKNQDSSDNVSTEAGPAQDFENMAIAVKNRPSIRRSESRSSISSPATRRRVDSPNVSAILSASRIAKTAGKKSYLSEEECAQQHVGQNDIQLQGSPVAKLSKTPVRNSRIHNTQVTPTAAGRSKKLSAPQHGILKRGEEPTPLGGTSKKSVIFSATIHEEDDDMMLDSPVLPITRTYGHNSSPVTPVKEKFDELLVSVSPRKFSLLYTPPQPGVLAPTAGKAKKPSTPYAGKGRKSRATAGENGEATPGLLAPATPDLITFDSPANGGTPKLRRSSRFKNNA